MYVRRLHEYECVHMYESKKKIKREGALHARIQGKEVNSIPFTIEMLE